MIKSIMGACALLVLSVCSADAARSTFDPTSRVDVHTVGPSQYLFIDPPSAQRFTRRAHSKRVSSHKHRATRVAASARAGGSLAKSLPAGNGLVDKAKQYIGQTARQVGVRTTLWCSAFVRKITGASGVNDLARSWLSKPRTSPQVGAIVVLTRGRGGSGHVGIVTGFKNGNPILISGNHGRRVGVGVYSKHRVLAYVTAT